MPAARRACVTPGRTARWVSFSSACESSVAAAASHSAASRRRSQWPGSLPGTSRPPDVDGLFGARQVLLGVDLAPAAIDQYRPQRDAARGDGVETVGQIGLAQGSRCPERLLEAARARLFPDVAQRGRAGGREAREAGELARGIGGGDLTLADARDEVGAAAGLDARELGLAHGVQ